MTKSFKRGDLVRDVVEVDVAPVLAPLHGFSTYHSPPSSQLALPFSGSVSTINLSFPRQRNDSVHVVVETKHDQRDLALFGSGTNYVVPSTEFVRVMDRHGVVSGWRYAAEFEPFFDED